MKQALATLLQEGAIAAVEVVDASVTPERVAALGVRSVPWLKLGPFILTGAQSLAELRRWLAWAEREDGVARYLEHLLRQGELAQARSFLAADASRRGALLAMLADPELGINVRLGVSALLEQEAWSAACPASAIGRVGAACRP